MRLHDLKASPGARRAAKRKGRGIGTGLGKTAGRGQKGQKSRSGSGVKRGFEGGQMPLQQRLPKRGFTNIFAKEYAIVNIEDLGRFAEGTEVTPELLQSSGIIRSLTKEIKILGRGDLSAGLTVKAHKFSKTAVEKIEGAGGRAEVI